MVQRFQISIYQEERLNDVIQMAFKILNKQSPLPMLNLKVKIYQFDHQKNVNLIT